MGIITTPNGSLYKGSLSKIKNSPPCYLKDGLKIIPYLQFNIKKQGKNI